MTYPILLGVSASNGVKLGHELALTVTGASEVLADDMVYMDGRPVVPDSVKMKGQKGMLYLTVPTDMTVGPSIEVYFLRCDGQMDEKSNSRFLKVVP